MNDTIERIQPDLVLVAHAWAGRQFINVRRTGPRDRRALRHRQRTARGAVEFIYPDAGSLGSYFGRDRGTPTLDDRGAQGLGPEGRVGSAAGGAAARDRWLTALRRLAKASLDIRDDGSCLGTTDLLQIYGANGDEVLDASLEISGRNVGVEVRARARGRGEIPVARQRRGRNGEALSAPSACERGSVQKFFRHFLLVEIAFAEDEAMAGRVVGRRGVANELGASQLVDVPVAVDADVIGDINPALRVLVVALVLADSTRGVAVVAEDHGAVVDRQMGEGVGACRRGGRDGRPRRRGTTSRPVGRSTSVRLRSMARGAG